MGTHVLIIFDAVNKSSISHAFAFSLSLFSLLLDNPDLCGSEDTITNLPATLHHGSDMVVRVLALR